MSEHTIKAFDTELQELVRKVAEMGGLAERQITDAIAALIKSAKPTLTPAQIRSALLGSAIDIGTAGIDRDSGVADRSDADAAA